MRARRRDTARRARLVHGLFVAGLCFGGCALVGGIEEGMLVDGSGGGTSSDAASSSTEGMTASAASTSSASSADSSTGSTVSAGGGGGGGPECEPGDTVPCYSGPDGTDGTPPCRSGARTCLDDGTFGACVGQVVPAEEVCEPGNDADQIDDDCDGDADETCRCGDGIVYGEEECDDGNDVDTDDCIACQDAICGDGLVWENHEVCDDPANVACVTCQMLPCGNGVVDEKDGETCDNGADGPDGSCNVVCTANGCGDGWIWPPEECDDGDNDSGDGCSADCAIES